MTSVSKSIPLSKISLALDWTPNTNHAGFFVAQSQGLFSDYGLDVSIISTDDPIYQGSYLSNNEDKNNSEYNTPCGLVAQGLAHFAINSPEGAINWNIQSKTSSLPSLKTVAALTQRNTSAIAARPNILRPKELDGKKYASYAARFEGRIVQQLIKNDGGKGEYEEVVQPMLGLWNTVLCDESKEGATDATWIFTAWEGVEAELRNADINLFYLEDYGIPYGYAPCLMASSTFLTQESETCRAFLKASAIGFQYASKHPQETAEIFIENSLVPKDHPIYTKAFLVRSMEILSRTFLTPEGSWGSMERKRWDTYLDWLDENGLLTTYTNSRHPKEGISTSLDKLRSGQGGARIPRQEIDSRDIFTNDFLQ